MKISLFRLVAQLIQMRPVRVGIIALGSSSVLAFLVLYVRRGEINLLHLMLALGAASAVGSLLFAVLTFTETLRLHTPRALKNPPGLRLISLVDFLYSAADVEKTFKPILSDWHKEYFKALAVQCVWRSRWISLKYSFRFAQAMGLSKVWQLVEKMIRVVSG